jgi:hypothetical protein
MTRGGLPHSDIPGSKLVCSSPGLFAACHVLHRLLAPRHSPYTLSSLTIRNSKLTLTNCLHISWSATVPCNTACPPSRLRATADECCGRKKLPCAEYSIVKDQAWELCPQSVNVGSVGSPLAQRSQPPRRRCARDSTASFAHRNFSKSRLRALRFGEKTFQPVLSAFALRASAGQLFAYIPERKVGGEYRARTGDLLVANQALSQLS